MNDGVGNATQSAPAHSPAHSPAPAPRPSAPVTPPTRLGEELPVYCEKCGYLLHGLPSQRCDHCELLYFRCPECGHTQPINTLRPAFQKILGRVRGWMLGFSVLFRLNYFGWLLFGWAAMGYEFSYRYSYIGNSTGGSIPIFAPRELDQDILLAFGLFALGFGIVSRMFLLRWRRSLCVGAVLAAVVVIAAACGVGYRQWERSTMNYAVASPWTKDLAMLLGIMALAVTIGAVIVWPIWCGLVRLLLPARTAKVLLEWQRSLAGPVDGLARE